MVDQHQALTACSRHLLAFKATLTKYRRRHQSCLFAGHRAVGEGRLDVCRDGYLRHADRQGWPPMLNLKDGVMPGRPAGCAARLGKTASLPGATRHTLRAFQTS